MKRLFWFKAACALAFAVCIGAGGVWAAPWSFGVMSDTQWIGADTDGKNPNSVPIGIIDQINPQIIRAGVKFVVQVGDLTDNGSSAALAERAKASRALYNAGIGFYPFRGNHESSADAAIQFQGLYPQTRGNGSNVVGATHFSSPSTNLKGLSYSFDYGNARFVLLDQFTPTDGKASDGTAYDVHNNAISSQQSWISSTLAGKPMNGHVFVFGHKNLIGQNHTDVLLGVNPGANPLAQKEFIDSLAGRGVRYLISGHDHIHQRSIVQAPHGTSAVQQIISGSESNKFYVPLGNSELPGSINNDVKYDNPTRETSLRQERNTIGYYIYTVDGPRVKVDYYSAHVFATLGKGEYLISSTPSLVFTKQETFGYSLNGKEFLVGGQAGTSYSVVQDSFGTTTAKILAGAYSNTAVDGSGRLLTQAIDTGWTSLQEAGGSLKSDVLSLWGMAKNLGSGQTDTYVLSMSLTGVSMSQMGSGKFFLLTKDDKGGWINAVDADYGPQSTHFVGGAWNESYGLGTYGIDPDTHVAWAVINHDGDFAVGLSPIVSGLR
jgi:hypothetical protein